jgi:hypothetical protein
MKRLGKVRGAILDALDLAGGSAAIAELATVLHKARPRDLRRRNLPMLEETGIVVVHDEVITLVDNWLEQLEGAREVGGEIEAEEVARRQLAIKRRGFHNRDKHPSDHAPTHEEIAVLEDARNVRRVRLALEALRTAGSGPAINLGHLMNGDMHNAEPLIKSVLRYLKVPDDLLDRWHAPVLEAAASVVSEASHEPEPPREPEVHPLDCTCSDCLYPTPRYARPYRRRSA